MSVEQIRNKFERKIIACSSRCLPESQTKHTKRQQKKDNSAMSIFAGDQKRQEEKSRKRFFYKSPRHSKEHKTSTSVMHNESSIIWCTEGSALNSRLRCATFTHKTLHVSSPPSQESRVSTHGVVDGVGVVPFLPQHVHVAVELTRVGRLQSSAKLNKSPLPLRTQITQATQTHTSQMCN